MPTEKQAYAAMFVCQMLSNLMQSVHLFRYDPAFGQLFIIAGERDGIEVVIFKDGRWEFTDNAEL